MTDRTTALEETTAHLLRVVEELSEVVARQDREIERLARRVALLSERAAEREADAGVQIPLADQKPPHW